MRAGRPLLDRLKSCAQAGDDRIGRVGVEVDHRCQIQVDAQGSARVSAVAFGIAVGLLRIVDEAKIGCRDRRRKAVGLVQPTDDSAFLIDGDEEG
jgi:hypothetical protein